MPIFVKGTSVFRVLTEEGENNEIIVKISSADLQQERTVHDADRGMGPEYLTTFSATLDSETGEEEVEWFVYEYPEGVLNHIERPTSATYELIEDFEFEGGHFPDDTSDE